MDRLSLLAVYAHPDDEAYGSAGTLAKYAAEGVHVALISATRGEAGEVVDPSLGAVGDLGSLREAELRRACAIMGVSSLRFLGCPDGAVASCERTETVGKIVAAIREWRPQVLITFGPEGIYGHLDHIAVHELVLLAADLAGKPDAYPEQLGDRDPFAPRKLYYRVIPAALAPQLSDVFLKIRAGLGLPKADITSFFAPPEAVTTRIDVAAFADVKRQAIAAHRSQTGGEPYPGRPAEDTGAELSFEYYRLRGARRVPGEPFETDLFAGLR